MQEEEAEEGTTIFKEEEVGDSMYIIYRGDVRIHKSSTTLAILKEREVFGELSLLDSETRSASATTETDCFLFKIDQEPFYELLEARPEVRRGIYQNPLPTARVKELRIRNSQINQLPII